MAEKSQINSNINKKDIDLILEVNKKAIEIETAVAEQNEEVLSLLSDIRDKHNKSDEKTDKLNEKVDKLSAKTEDLTKDMFKLQVLFVSGLLSLIIQIVQIFVKK